METGLEDIKQLGRETVELDLAIQRLGKGKREQAAKLRELRDRLLEAPGQVVAYYKVTEVLTREMSLKDAVNVWQQMREQLSEMFNSWSTSERMNDPVIDGILAHYCEVLKGLIMKAEREYRKYAETAHLLGSSANAKRLKEAFADTRKGRTTRWGSVEELIKSKRG